MKKQTNKKVCVSLYTIVKKMLLSQCHLLPPNYEMLNKAISVPHRTCASPNPKFTNKRTFSKTVSSFLNQLASKQISLSLSRQSTLTSIKMSRFVPYIQQCSASLVCLFFQLLSPL